LTVSDKIAAQGELDIDRDAMRTTIWQVLIGTFTASYVTLYVALTFSAHSISAWAAAIVAMVVAILLAAMILILFLMIIRLDPKRFFRLTDFLIDWTFGKRGVVTKRVSVIFWSLYSACLLVCGVIILIRVPGHVASAVVAFASSLACLLYLWLFILRGRPQVTKRSKA
jgi:O-antigen/teichoic acid export membrane protein